MLINKKITTILFDLDGTLLDTNPLIIKTFEETLKHYLPDRVFTKEDIMEFIGPTLKQTFDTLYKEKTEEIIKYYREINRKLHDDMVVVYPTVREGLELLKANNYTLGVVSSKKRDMVIHGLKYTKLNHLFDLVMGHDDVTNPKPDPEPIYIAMERLNCSKENVIYVGDNSHDIEAGNNAGVVSVGVAWSLRGAQYLKQFNPDYIIEDMKDLINIIHEVNNKNGK
ncbi:MAG: HAD-superfamily hydrolase, subfamily variant 1 [Haloplasmataceae bacterium]|nr:HAD-superfamily hydrolase, subfamily variant 1 [Haloplasmataceae bacterium]